MAITDQSGEAQRPLQQFFKDLGPGLITGAADDDPSGISTYSVAGATFGYTGLWTALFSFPLMVAVQLMCARLGMVTGEGLAAVIRTRYSRWILWPACALLLIANTFNIGADLGGMADAMQMVTGVRAYFWTPLFAGAIVALLFGTSYRAHRQRHRGVTVKSSRRSRHPILGPVLHEGSDRARNAASVRDNPILMCRANPCGLVEGTSIRLRWRIATCTLGNGRRRSPLLCRPCWHQENPDPRNRVIPFSERWQDRSRC